MKDEREHISSLCRKMSKPRGRICGKWIRERFSMAEDSLGQELDFWVAAGGEAKKTSLKLL